MSEEGRESTSWFSNLFKATAISMNISSIGPVTITSVPNKAFDKTVIENLSVRAILSTGVGDNLYKDHRFTSRITLPKMSGETYEALIYTFVTEEDNDDITLELNSDSLSLLLFIYPRKERDYINKMEEKLEILLQNYTYLPKKVSELTSTDCLTNLLENIQGTIIELEKDQFPHLNKPKNLCDLTKRKVVSMISW